jgi:protein gp37
MSETTAISWCDSTLNLEMGCNGCELWNGGIHTCYAGILTERYGGKKGWPRAFEIPTLFPDRLGPALAWSDLTGKDRQTKPWLNGLPRIVFLNDMGDTFTEALPKDWIAPYLPQLASSPHQWLILTKRPRRAEWMAAIPRNVWMGISATDQATYDARASRLTLLPAKTRFVSLEPLLGPIDIGIWADLIDWVIIGGESGPNYRPMKPEWAAVIRNACAKADIPFFFKQSAGPRTEMNPTLNGLEYRGMPRP